MNISFYNENSAKNALRIDINHVSFFFSYNTLVGVQYLEPNNLLRTAVRRNEWQTTTGKHLNWIDGGDKKERLSKEEFDVYVEQAMLKAGVSELPTVNIF